MATVAILGGGISGLSCAYYLRALGKSKIKYIFLLEKSPKFGGWIQTTRFPDGALFEHGPRTLRCNTKSGYNALALAEELGLSSRIIPIHRESSAAKNNYILANNELQPLPRGMSLLFKKSKLLGARPLSLIIKELTTKPEEHEDESVYDFVTRRVGEHAAKYLFDPLCRGISAGDARELSLRSMFPSVYDAEKTFGSVIKGMSKEGRQVPPDFMFSSLVQTSHKQFWRMWTLRGGLTELIDALACNIEEQGVTDLIFNAKCHGLKFKSDKTADVLADNETIGVDHVFSCIPSYELSSLVPSYPVLSQELRSISTVDVAVVYLEYAGDVLKYEGFGVLAPSFEDSKVLGITFDSCCFPALNGKSETRLTCMMGGKWFRDIFGDSQTVSEQILLETAISEASRHLQISDAPVRHKVLVQKKCIPQYLIGHHMKLKNMEDEINKHGLCLSLLGASYKGAGVPDCIYNAKMDVENYLKSL